MNDVVLPTLRDDQGKILLMDYFLRCRDLDIEQGRYGIPDRELEFLGFCLGLIGHSRSQRFQDLYVLYRLGLKNDGFFVEFGATDGILRSNTLFFEKELGWKGILAEPFGYWHEALRQNRSCPIDTRCLWSRSGESLAFHGAESAELATLSSFVDDDYHSAERHRSFRTSQVTSVSLNDLLNEHSAPSAIDYISVDTEGSELEILSAFDFSKHHVSIFSVEHNHHPQRREAIHSLMRSHGYVREFEKFSAFDDWYYKE